MSDSAIVAIVAGSPAPAGIDRIMLLIMKQKLRFPRTRGDRPMVRIPLVSIPKVPPHPRG